MKQKEKVGGPDVIDVVVFPCTYRCDGRCIMCTVYKRKSNEHTVEYFKGFFADPALRGLKSINITGGEPTLREDLGEMVGMISSHCRQLREVIINTNGFDAKRITQRIYEIYNTLPSSIKLWVYVSLDALDERADLIRGVKNAAVKAIKSIRLLKEMKNTLPNIEVGISCTITALNYGNLNEVHRFAKQEDLYIDFIYATVNTAYINSKPNEDKFILNSEQKEEVISFFENLSSFQKISSPEYYYRKLINRLKGLRDNKECLFRSRRGVLLEADGKVRVCGMTDDCLLGELDSKMSLKDMLDNIPKEMNKYCENCETDSYYSWTDEAQEEMMRNMLNNLKIKRSKKKRTELCDR